MSNIMISVWEMLGTATLTLLGCGVVANVLLAKTKHDGTGSWVLITIGWGVAVFAGASIATASKGQLNPALTLGLAIAGKTPWAQVPFYFLGQFVGGFIGAVLAWLAYKAQFDENPDNSGTVDVFATGPEIHRPAWNLVTEIIATFVLVLFIAVGPYQTPANYAAAATIVLGIGASLGGATGYSINPARDLSPRLAHAVLPIPRKGGSNWAYAPVAFFGPFIGGALAGLLAGVLPATS